MPIYRLCIEGELMNMAMTPKKHRFAEEYLIDLNATRAAIRAGYSVHTAYSMGPRLLEDVEVASLIDQLKRERSERTSVDAAWVLKRLVAEVDADMGDLYGPDGEMLPIADWPLIWRTGLIVGIDSEEIENEGTRVGVVRKVKQSDRIKRLELIGRHVGVQAFKDQVDVKVTDGLADRLARAKARTGLS